MPSITFECEDCGHQEEREMRKVYGETEFDDDYQVIGDEVETCVKCGSAEIHEYTNGIKLHDEGREDFHSDV